MANSLDKGIKELANTMVFSVLNYAMSNNVCLHMVKNSLNN